MTGEPLPPEVAAALRVHIAWAQREDGDPSANDPKLYRLLRSAGPRGEDVVWGPGGVLVFVDGLYGYARGEWVWADDVIGEPGAPDLDDYYTSEYRKCFP